MEPDKRELRQLKREIKRAGNQRARRVLKRVLAERPEDAPFVEPAYGRYRSADLNGIEHDATRRGRGEGWQRDRADSPLYATDDDPEPSPTPGQP